MINGTKWKAEDLAALNKYITRHATTADACRAYISERGGDRLYHAVLVKAGELLRARPDYEQKKKESKLAIIAANANRERAVPWSKEDINSLLSFMAMYESSRDAAAAFYKSVNYTKRLNTISNKIGRIKRFGVASECGGSRIPERHTARATHSGKLFSYTGKDGLVHHMHIAE